MSNETVLVVDDDEALAEMLGLALRRRGFQTVLCHRGDRAFGEYRRVQPDLVLLDIMLPGLSGTTVCNQIRSSSDVPIVMLSAKADSADIVNGLGVGADDYIVKPFNVAELVARVQARLRPREQSRAETVAIGDVVLDLAAHRVTRAGEELTLTPLEFDLLLELGRRPWRAFSREELLQEVWGYQHTADTRLVNVHIQRLRAKIEPDADHPRYVLTVRGVGYRAGQ